VSIYTRIPFEYCFSGLTEFLELIHSLQQVKDSLFERNLKEYLRSSKIDNLSLNGPGLKGKPPL
jgi:hypothetical protein